MSAGMPSDAVERPGTCRDLQVQASTRTGSGDAKQVDFRAHSASIKGSQWRGYRLTGITGAGDAAPGSVGEMVTGWSVSQGVSQQLPERCLNCLNCLQCHSATAQGGAHCRGEADKGLRIPSQCWEPAVHCPGAAQPAPPQHILGPESISSVL